MTDTENKRLSADEKRSNLRYKDYAYLRDLKDPCVKESELTFKCLDDTGYDRTKCEEFFLNYRCCRKFWARVEKDRKQKGIVPHLPLPNERESVKKEYTYLISGTKPSS